MKKKLTLLVVLLLLFSFSGCEGNDRKVKGQSPDIAQAREEVLPLMEFCFQKDGIQNYAPVRWKLGKCTGDAYIAVIGYEDAEGNLQNYPFLLKSIEDGMVVTDFGPNLEVPQYTTLFEEEITPEIIPDATAVAGYET